MDEQTLSDSLNNVDFIRQVEQTLLISQQVYDAFNHLIAKYEEGLSTIEQARESNTEILNQSKEIKQEMLREKENLLGVLTQAQTKLQEVNAFVSEKKESIANTLQENQNIKNSIETLKDEFNTAFENTREVLRLIQDRENLLNELQSLISENTSLKTEINQEITSNANALKAELEEIFNRLKEQLQQGEYASKIVVDNILSIMPSFAEGGNNDEIEALILQKESKEAELTRKEREIQSLEQELQQAGQRQDLDMPDELAME